jgi:predicted nucleic acid-binding protein
MEKARKSIAPLDMLIANLAVSLSVVLVTNDKAFAQFRGLDRENWLE